MGTLTDEIPKALLKVQDKSLIDHMLSFTDHPFVTDIGVVGGHGFPLLKKHLEGKRVKLFENTNYENGNLFSLMAALDFLGDDFLVFQLFVVFEFSQKVNSDLPVLGAGETG